MNSVLSGRFRARLNITNVVFTERRAKMKSIDGTLHKPSYWQLVFMQSKANGAAYNGEGLPRRSWDWPKNTYLQRRLGQEKYLHAVENSRFN
jgi:hypothetical protein